MALNENSVFFKRGLSKNLFDETTGKVKSNIVKQGGFYLTTDTNRLYYGAKDNEIAEINRYIKTIESLTDGSKLPEANDGDFLYIKNDNILAVWNNGAWKQVNPDTDTNTQVIGLSFAKDETQSDDTKLVYKATITQQEKGGGDGTPIEGYLTIDATTLAEIIPDIGVNVGVTVANKKATVKTKNVDGKTGAAGDGFTIEGDGTVVSVEATSTGIKISGDLPEYDLNSPAKTTEVILSKDGSDTDKVTFKASTANDDLVIDGSNADEIIYGHKTYSADTVIQKDSETTQQPQHEGTFTAVSGVKTSNGHVTEVVTTTYKLPEDKNTTYFIPEEDDKDYGDGIVADNTGKITIKLIGSDGNTDYGSVSGQDLFYTLDDASQTKIYNQGELPIYEIVNKSLQGVNALTYKGTVGLSASVTTTESELPTTKVSIGDTYLVAVEGTYNGISAEVGDLFIATGEETDGVISKGLAWTYVPSGDDVDTQYTFTAQADGIIRLTNAANDKDYDQIKLKAGTDIEIATETTGADGVINIKHKNYSYAAQDQSEEIELEHEGSFKAITGLTVTNGHVSAAQVSEFVLPEDKNTTYTLPVTKVSAGTNTSTKITLTGTDGSPDDVYFDAEQANNDSISVTVKDNDHIVFEHKDFGDWTNPTATDATKPLESEQIIKLVTGATVDNGHITALITTDYTLPVDKDSKYTLSGAVVATDTTNTNALSSITITDALTGSASADGQDSSSTLTISSNTLNLTAGTNAYSVELEWGTF